MEENNQNVDNLTAVSNKIVLSRSNFNVPQRRVLAAIIESISPLLKQEITKIKQGSAISVEPLIDQTAKITYKASLLSRPDDYGELRKALTGLQQRIISWEYMEEGEKVFVSTPLIGQHKFKERSEVVEIWVFHELYDFLLDLSQGYTLYQTGVLLSFTSIYAMRIYEILAKWRNKGQFYITMDELRWLTDTTDKFERNNDFKRKVIDIAKEQLDESEITDLRFDYKEKKQGRKIIGFDFYIYKTENAHDHSTKKLERASLRWDFSKELTYNFERFGLNIKGKNLDTVKALKVLLGEKTLAEKMESLHEVAKDKANPAGYIITSLKNALITHDSNSDDNPRISSRTIEKSETANNSNRNSAPKQADFENLMSVISKNIK